MQRSKPKPALCALVLALAASLVLGGDVRWYILEMQGDRAGWMVERERAENGRIVSESETRLKLRRDQTVLTLEFFTRFIETEDGEPIEFLSRSNLGGAPSEERAVFTPDEVVLTQTQNGVSQSKSMPSPEGRWLPPAAAARYTGQRLRAGADRVVVRTLDPLAGLDPVTTTRTGFEPATIEVMGRSVPALKCITTSSLQPGVESEEYIDEHGRLLRSDVDMGVWRITVLAADEQLARSPLDPPELMRSVFITPDRAIERPARAKRAAYIVAATSGDLPDLPETGSQRVERLDERRLRVRRDLHAVPLPAGPIDTERLTAPSVMIGADDPRVIELTTTALGAAPDDPSQRAERLRRFVHRYIRTKDLSVGFASASEVARTREGDCTEHAVLLAAMLRADSIPARVVSGLIYADNFAGAGEIFGYHMWTQAALEIEGELRWVDLDATLPDALPVTATHIALGVSELSDGARLNALVELAPLMGRLSIAVEGVE